MFFCNTFISSTSLFHSSLCLCTPISLPLSVSLPPCFFLSLFSLYPLFPDLIDHLLSPPVHPFPHHGRAVSHPIRSDLTGAGRGNGMMPEPQGRAPWGKGRPPPPPPSWWGFIDSLYYLVVSLETPLMSSPFCLNDRYICYQWVRNKHGIWWEMYVFSQMQPT